MPLSSGTRLLTEPPGMHLYVQVLLTPCPASHLSRRPASSLQSLLQYFFVPHTLPSQLSKQLLTKILVVLANLQVRGTPGPASQLSKQTQLHSCLCLTPCQASSSPGSQLAPYRDSYGTFMPSSPFDAQLNQAAPTRVSHRCTAIAFFSGSAAGAQPINTGSRSGIKLAPV